MRHPKDWQEWGELYINIDLWRPIVKEILEKEGIPYTKIGLSGHPGTHAVFQIDNEYILKIFTPLAPYDFRVESEMLKSHQGDHLPEQIAYGQVHTPDTWEYIIVTMVDGKPYRDVEKHMSIAEKRLFVENLAEMLKGYHSSNGKDINTSIPEWPIEAESHLLRVKAALNQIDRINEHVGTEVITFLQNYMPKGSPNKTIIHADVTGDHVFLEKISGQWRISGLIDFADSKLTNKKLELPAIWFELLQMDVQLMRWFISVFESEELNDQWLKNNMYFTLLHQFGIHMLKSCLDKNTNVEIQSFDDLLELMWPKVLVE